MITHWLIPVILLGVVKHLRPSTVPPTAPRLQILAVRPAPEAVAAILIWERLKTVWHLQSLPFHR